jgi:hypothetical protein
MRHRMYQPAHSHKRAEGGAANLQGYKPSLTTLSCLVWLVARTDAPQKAVFLTNTPPSQLTALVSMHHERASLKTPIKNRVSLLFCFKFEQKRHCPKEAMPSRPLGLRFVVGMGRKQRRRLSNNFRTCTLFASNAGSSWTATRCHKVC